MSTQETVTEMQAGQPLYAATLALLTLLLLGQTNWIWSSLYFQYHTASEITLAFGLLATFVIVCIALLRGGLGQATTIKMINVGIALLLTLVGFAYLKQLELIPMQSNALHKTLAVASAITASLLTLKITIDTWKRLYLAGIVGGMIFIFFPVVLANTNASTVYWPSPSYQPPTIAAPNMPSQNTIVLLLDELSASSAGPVVKQLQATGLHVTATNIDPAGKNTINVIPAIWMRTNFDQSVACGPTQLCSTSKVLDFSKVKASSENIDIVGFYHRYCSIQGLRSCSFSPFPTKSAATELACSYPGGQELKFLGCEASESDRKSFLALRDNMKKMLMEAPFWKKGGILFAHLLVPHPLMGIPLKTLNEEYSDNITYGASVVGLVAHRAKLVFGDNFRIVVFSDHPLRPEIWCADKTYMAIKCKPDSSQISNQVPLIIATFNLKNKAPLKIENNKDVFDLLYQFESK
ncbi:hypothetical protein [Janthinobacterium sp. SUN120]|uniref:hypothetical protein n=1 Tax=Janthinobacterium sp. SUN120 TaxID=3004099 RepID=UPI0025B1B5E6|nr:hypothetical protein [Janthinobacterium sp. SUN120]MDN2716643.1 hypothetical protein [Janthinobacterium sp. SUN120]